MPALTWCCVVRRVEPPVWTAISVWEQSTLLLTDWVQTPLPLVRVVAGSAAVLRYWSLVSIMAADPVVGLAAIPESSRRSLLPVHVTPASHTPQYWINRDAVFRLNFLPE